MHLLKKLYSGIFLAHTLLTGMDLMEFPPLPSLPTIPGMNLIASEPQSDVLVPNFFANEYWQDPSPLLDEQGVEPCQDSDGALSLALAPLESKEIKRVDCTQQYFCCVRGCSSIFETTKKCEQHIMSSHITLVNPALKAFLCMQCGQRFTLKHESMAHVREHHLVTDDQSITGLVHKDIGLWSQLKNILIILLQESLRSSDKMVAYEPGASDSAVHQLASFRGIKPKNDIKVSKGPYLQNGEYTCALCGKIYKQPIRLTKHILKTHGALKK